MKLLSNFCDLILYLDGIFKANNFYLMDEKDY